MANSTAYCYLDDGRRKVDRRMREWSVASLRHHCGDVDVCTLTMDGLYANPFDGETVVDVAAEVDDVDGVLGPGFDPSEFRAGSLFPNILYVKLLAPLVRRFAGYGRVVVLDSDIEVVSPEFAGIAELEFPRDVDVMAVRHLCCMIPQETLEPSCDVYLRAGLLVFRPLRGDEAGGYRTRLRHGMDAFSRVSPACCEEAVMNVALRRRELPPRFNVTSNGAFRVVPGVCSLHYAGGVAKDVASPRWKERFDTVYSTPARAAPGEA